jgi:hypothetical protein
MAEHRRIQEHRIDQRSRPDDLLLSNRVAHARILSIAGVPGENPRATP